MFWFDSSDTVHNARNSAIYSNVNNQYIAVATFLPVNSQGNQLRFSLNTKIVNNNVISSKDYLTGFITNSNFNYYGSLENKIYKVIGYKYL